MNRNEERWRALADALVYAMTETGVTPEQEYVQNVASDAAAWLHDHGWEIEHFDLRLRLEEVAHSAASWVESGNRPTRAVQIDPDTWDAIMAALGPCILRPDRNHAQTAQT